MNDIKNKMNQLKEAKELAEEREGEAECAKKSLMADKDAVSSFIHMHIYCRLLMLLPN